jgi:hypothetical protein
VAVDVQDAGMPSGETRTSNIEEVYESAAAEAEAVDDFTENADVEPAEDDAATEVPADEAETAPAVDEPSPSDEVAEDPIAPTPTPSSDLPDWVRQPPKSVPNVHRVAIESGWFDNRSTCERMVDQIAYREVSTYLQALAFEETGGSTYVPLLAELGISPRFVRENYYSETEAPYLEVRDFSHADGMQNLHVLLEFDRNDTDNLLARWRAYERQERIQVVAVMMGGVLATLAGALGLIKLDTYTKGYYTKRLFIGVPAAIIGVLGMMAMLS